MGGIQGRQFHNPINSNFYREFPAQSALILAVTYQPRVGRVGNTGVYTAIKLQGPGDRSVAAHS